MVEESENSDKSVSIEMRSYTESLTLVENVRRCPITRCDRAELGREMSAAMDVGNVYDFGLSTLLSVDGASDLVHIMNRLRILGEWTEPLHIGKMIGYDNGRPNREEGRDSGFRQRKYDTDLSNSTACAGDSRSVVRSRKQATKKEVKNTFDAGVFVRS